MTAHVGGELVVSSWGGIWESTLRRAVSGPFTAHTGISVRHVTRVGLSLPAELTEALRAGRPAPFDVVWSNAVPALQAAADGTSDALTPDDVPNLEALHPRARLGLVDWPVATAYVVLYVLVFRHAAFGGGPPESWRVLLDEQHRAKVALYPDGNGIHPVAQVLGGGELEDIPDAMEPCWRFLRRLRPQIGVIDYSIGMEQQLLRGELNLCFRALPNALGFQAAGAEVGWTAPCEGVPDTADVLWIPRGLPPERVRAARAYIDWALSRPVQERWCELLGVLPARRDLAAPARLRAAARTPASLDDRGHLLHVSDATKLAHDAAWRARFRACVGDA